MENLSEQKFDLIVFDIDGTLTRSKLPLDVEMSTLLCELLGKFKVGIISGAAFGQFQRQILDCLTCMEDRLNNLYLLPTDGTIFCYDNHWQCESDAPFSEKEKQRIKMAFKHIFEAVGLDHPTQVYGDLIEDRGAQLNFSAFGQDAPIELKEGWDPDNVIRMRMVEVLKRTISDFSIRIGGTTSIEITKFGIDKAYGLRKLMDRVGISHDKILYIGDKLFAGGNDAPVLTLGITCQAVSSPEETKKIIKHYLD
jgi:HAD superfamily hydrolase (TIGR01484 family)